MFMNYLITGIALLFGSAFIFSPGKMKHNGKRHRFYNGTTMKKVRKTITLLLFLVIIVLFFIHPKMNIVIPLFFIAVGISPAKKNNNINTYDHDTY